jgi:hypothetical protein
MPPEGDLHPFVTHLQYFKDVLALPLKPMASCIVFISRRPAPALGPDGRQWRHLLADEELPKKFRIIAFDMPWHGKSNLPANWTSPVNTTFPAPRKRRCGRPPRQRQRHHHGATRSFSDE